MENFGSPGYILTICVLFVCMNMYCIYVCICEYVLYMNWAVYMCAYICVYNYICICIYILFLFLNIQSKKNC